MPFTLFVGFPTSLTWSFPTSKLDLLPYAKPGGVPLHVPVPAPPKSEFEVILPHDVEDGLPAISKDADVTSAPDGNVRLPANPSPVPVNVCVYDVEPSWNCVSVTSAAASGDINDSRNIEVSNKDFFIYSTSLPCVGLRPTGAHSISTIPRQVIWILIQN